MITKKFAQNRKSFRVELAFRKKIQELISQYYPSHSLHRNVNFNFFYVFFLENLIYTSIKFDMCSFLTAIKFSVHIQHVLIMLMYAHT